MAFIWVKCGFSSAATSAFYTFKIRRSAGPQIRILPPAGHVYSIRRGQYGRWAGECSYTGQCGQYGRCVVYTYPSLILDSGCTDTLDSRHFGCKTLRHHRDGHTKELQIFRTQDLSFPRTKGLYGELSFLRNESSRKELSFPGSFVPRNFRPVWALGP